MPVEFISAVHPNPATEGGPTAGTGIDVDYARRYARALDDGGFDYTLVTYHSASPDALRLAQFVAHHTERIKPVLAHRLFDPDTPGIPDAAWRAAGDIFTAALRLGRTLTGEHGVGTLKRRWLVGELGPEQHALQHRIKAAFDPHLILNPGKAL
jgi:FAD/FMN-containing dehydrogenase